MIKKNLGDTLLQEKPTKALMLIKGSAEPVYASVIAREIDSTYAHTLNVLSRLERLRLLRFEKTGRIKLVKLTNLGAKVANVLEALLDLEKLSQLGTRMNRSYEKAMRQGAKLDLKAVTKRFTVFKEEFSAFEEKDNPDVRDYAEELKNRADKRLEDLKKMRKSVSS